MARTFLILATLLAAAGCSGPPTEPDRSQVWMTLDEYQRRASESTLLVYPVITVPEGAIVELRISKKPTELVGDQLNFIFYDALEPVDDQMVTVRLRARKAVHLDLEHLLASTDKKSWMPLAFHFFPFWRDSRVSVSAGGGNPQVVVPVLTSVDQRFLIRDSLSDLRLR